MVVKQKGNFCKRTFCESASNQLLAYYFKYFHQLSVHFINSYLKALVDPHRWFHLFWLIPPPLCGRVQTVFDWHLTHSPVSSVASYYSGQITPLSLLLAHEVQWPLVIPAMAPPTFNLCWFLISQNRWTHLCGSAGLPMTNISFSN